MNYALIENGVVTNIIWLNETNAHEFPNSVNTKNRPLDIGDTYDGADFYRDGVKVLTPLEAAKAEIADMQAALELLGVSVDE